MTYLEFSKLAAQTTDDAVADYALWNRTPFPFDGRPRQLWKAIDGWRRACKNGIRLCEFCDHPAVDDWNCQRCNDALNANRP